MSPEARSLWSETPRTRASWQHGAGQGEAACGGKLVQAEMALRVVALECGGAEVESRVLVCGLFGAEHDEVATRLVSAVSLLRPEESWAIAVEQLRVLDPKGCSCAAVMAATRALAAALGTPLSDEQLGEITAPGPCPAGAVTPA